MKMTYVFVIGTSTSKFNAEQFRQIFKGTMSNIFHSELVHILFEDPYIFKGLNRLSRDADMRLL